jgi:hypothetical protein
MRRVPFAVLLLPALVGLLSGCDQLGIESPSAVKARAEADSKAVGGACRHAGRAIEDCYTLNKKAEKAAMYAGWREMNEYMRENKLEAVVPVISPETSRQAKAVAEAPSDGDAPDGPADNSASRKTAAKH